MRIRTIKPEFHQHEEMSEVSAEAALLAIALLNYADDEGWFKLHGKLIESSVFPLRELSMSIHELLTELENIKYFTVHEGSDGKKYGHISNFLKHQRVNRPTPSEIAKIIAESTDSIDSYTSHPPLTESSLPEGKGKEGNGKGNGMEVERGKESSGGGTDTLPQIIEQIAQAYPKQSHHRETREAIQAAIKRLSKREAITDIAAAVKIRELTKLIAEKINAWPLGERQTYAPTPPNFFTGDRWADDPEEFTSRKVSNAITDDDDAPQLNLGGRKAKKITDLRQP